jgi:hypothetical protein
VDIFNKYNFFFFFCVYDHTHLIFILSSFINIYHGYN